MRPISDSRTPHSAAPQGWLSQCGVIIGGVTGLLRRHDQAFNTFEVALISPQVTTMEISAFFTAIVSPRRIHSLQSLTLRLPRIVLSMLAERGAKILVRNVAPHKVLCASPRTSHYSVAPNFNDDEFVGLIRNWPDLEVLHLMCF